MFGALCVVRGLLSKLAVQRIISRFSSFLLQSQCTAGRAVRFDMLSSPMETLPRFLPKHVKSWGPCCDLFTTGWRVWRAENECRRDSANKCKPDLYCNGTGWMPPGMYKLLEELGTQEAAQGHQLQHLGSSAQCSSCACDSESGSATCSKPWWGPQVGEGCGVVLKASMIFLENVCHSWCG